MPRIV